ncbi:MAG: U32 family peptidase [Bacteroidales bacterium]|nr:U32 family peptidase [Bacteroidales bacterium]
MSPVGSYESLMASIQAGAGSIYFGIEQLNMRARSTNNFTINDLREISKICTDYNVKTYLTVNAIIYDKDISLMRKIVDAAKENNISAIIASDISVIQYAFSIGVEVHISTQLSISNAEALKFYAQFADVIVLARELDLKQVKEIHRFIIDNNICGPKGNLIQIEMFIHGALCMAISGKCYLSLHEKNYSANRGGCLQTCRKAYEVKEVESGNSLIIDNEYIMSPKDLCTIEFLDQVLDAGVSILKIEGRARSPEYVKTVTSAYHEAVEAYLKNEFTPELGTILKQKLETVFNRGFWNGYYLGQRLGEWSRNYGSLATERKVFLGIATNYFANAKVVEFLLQTGDLQLNDKIIITGPTTGVIEMTLNEIRVDFQNVEIAKKGEQVSILVDERVRRNDKLFVVKKATEVDLQ